MPVITIRGQLGSGAPQIGRLVADILKIDYVDREIIAEVATKIDRSDSKVITKESPPSNLLEKIGEVLEHRAIARGVSSAYLPTWAMPLDDKHYLTALRFVIRELAKTHRIVIRGRGSQLILKDYPKALHVLVVAPLEMRVKRVMKEMKLDEKSAKQEIKRSDGSRREFTKRYFRARLEDPVLYDLVINTKKLSCKAAASIVVDALYCREGRNK